MIWLGIGIGIVATLVTQGILLVALYIKTLMGDWEHPL